MKKLLTVSLVAMMAVTTARAEIASKAYVDQKDGNLTNLTTSAKDNLVAAINSVQSGMSANTSAITTLNGDENTAGSVAKKIADALDAADVSTALQDVATATGDANGVVSAVGKDGTDVTVTKALVAKSNLASALVTEIEGKADTADLGALASKDEVAESDLASALATKINGKADASSLATVATTGDYDDLTDKPTLGTAAALDSTTTISENGAGLPTAGTVYSYVADAVAAEANVQADWDQTTTTADDYIKNKPTLGALAAKDEVAKTDLASALVTEIEGKANTADLGALASKDEVAESDLASALATKINGKADASSLATVATTGDYDDLTDKPTLGTAAAANVSTNGVAASESGLVTGDQVNTAINSANTTALDALDLTDAQATGTGVVTQVTQTNGQVAVTKADPLTTMNYDTQASGVDLGDGSYSLTMKVVSGTPTYKWELIERGTGE